MSDFGSGHDLTVQFVSSSPAMGSVLTDQSLEPASDSVSPSLSAPPPLTLSLSLSLSFKNKHEEQKQKQCDFDSSPSRGSDTVTSELVLKDDTASA